MHRWSRGYLFVQYILCWLLLSYAQCSRRHRACSRGDANSDQQMSRRRRRFLPSSLVDLGWSRGAADGRRLLSHVRVLRHPRRIIIRHGCGEAPHDCHLVASRPRAAVPSLSWGGVPPTAAED